MTRDATLGVRAAAPSDVPELLAMMADFNRLEHIDWYEAPALQALRRLLEQPELGAVRMLYTPSATAGYFVLSWGYDLEWHGRDAVLTELYLHPDQRGHGLASAALEHVRACALEASARALHLAVRHENTAARRAYERAGFREVERILMSQKLVGCDRSKL